MMRILIKNTSAWSEFSYYFFVLQNLDDFQYSILVNKNPIKIKEIC